MRKPSAALLRKWAAAFPEDLEGTNRDGPLSSAGKLHAIEETAEEHARLAHRITDGNEYYQWARSLLHTRRWTNGTDKRIWQLHCDGMSLKSICQVTGMKYHYVNGVVDRIKAKVKQGSKRRQTNYLWRKKPAQKQAGFSVLTWERAIPMARLLLQGMRSPRPKSS